MVHSRNGSLGNAVRSVTTTRKPHGIECGIIGTLEQSRETYLVRPSEMTFNRETLRMKMQFDAGELYLGQRHHAVRILDNEWSGRSTDGNADHCGDLDEFVLWAKAEINFAVRVCHPPDFDAPDPVVMKPQPSYRSGMNAPSILTSHPWFFCGIGGSGMLPLALILKGQGAEVGGSDRSRDQGRTPQKFAWLEQLGFTLFPQDGSGITEANQTLVASAAIEDTVPEVVRAKELGCPRMSRAELLAELFNAAPIGIAIGGTSGKSTVTGMAGWIMVQAGRDPTIMNGAVMKNFVAPDAPFASARVGNGEVFVSEVDESDGSIALYRPKVAVLGNVSLDHKSMEELRQLFGDFLAGADISAVNIDDTESTALASRARALVSFGIDSEEAMIGVEPRSVAEGPTSLSATILDRRDSSRHSLTLKVPGRHNLANALAAIAAASAAGVPVPTAVAALTSFVGLARRFDIVGTSPSGITVIDDFGHNPDKVSATLATLKVHPGRIIAFFQPHGYGPLRQMGHELAQVFAQKLDANDITILCDPVYFGGTVDRTEGSDRIVRLITDAGGQALHIPSRDDCAAHIASIARPGDRIVVMGARDDTLTLFAKELLARLD